LKKLALFRIALAVAALFASTGAASAAIPPEQTKALLSEERSAAGKAVEAMAAARDPAALALLEALAAGTLRIDVDGAPFVSDEAGKLSPLAGRDAGAKPPIKTPLVDNRLRRVLESSLASLRLGAADPEIRLKAAQELSKRRNDDLAPVLRSSLSKESDGDVKEALLLAIAQIDLSSEDVNRRLAALKTIEDVADPAFKPELERIVQKDGQGNYVEKNETVRRAAHSALAAVERHAMWIGMVGHLFYGVSLGSVLLLAALGLAITFGLMRVINMAHGELLMIGAYSAFTVQKAFQAYAPDLVDWYLIVSVPVAFVVCAAIGMLLERTVLRFLYGRPLETLLATWGISLILIQTVRLIFGAQNVTVANPSWLSGGVELLPGFVLTYSRLTVILFSAAVIGFVWYMLQKTPLGLQVRAITQNREMAAGMGIATRKVDMLTFGIGSGVAGLGGVALSQLGNVGPELGQTYIVDSFMVVVLGGVGKLAGTLAGALGLGIVNKVLEPAAGAVLGKIIILGFIILFIQRRPQGIFALKGRSAEVA
jgi:urea transport system permease protein